MAMTMMGDIQLHSNREAVWAKLNDCFSWAFRRVRDDVHFDVGVPR
jgi:hypothetical protein